MKFKAKLRKIGNSWGIIVPKEVITYLKDEWKIAIIEKGAYVYLEVITDDSKYMDYPEGVITSNSDSDKKVITSTKQKDKNVITKENNVITKKDKKQEVITSKSNKVITSVKKPQKVITSKSNKKLVFNVKTGLNEWV